MAEKYIRDLLDLPTQVNKGDFVLNLAAGVSQSNAAATLRNYVVTPQLVSWFRSSTGLHQRRRGCAVEQGVLPARQFRQRQEPFHGGAAPAASEQLQGVRAIKELAPVVAKHNAWTQGRKFLLYVPFHMIGSRSMEQGILGRYAEYVRQLHLTVRRFRGFTWQRACLKTPRALRSDMGDEAFFTKLNQKRKAVAPDGEASPPAGTPQLSEAAVATAPGERERTRLVGDLIGRVLSQLPQRGRWPGTRLTSIWTRDWR